MGSDHEQAYTADFGSVLTRVQDRMVSRKAVEGRAYSAVVAAASGKQHGSSSGCYRCGGGHRVKECLMNPLVRGVPLRRLLQRRRSRAFAVEARSTWLRIVLSPHQVLVP